MLQFAEPYQKDKEVDSLFRYSNNRAYTCKMKLAHDKVICLQIKKELTGVLIHCSVNFGPNYSNKQ